MNCVSKSSVVNGIRVNLKRYIKKNRANQIEKYLVAREQFSDAMREYFLLQAASIYKNFPSVGKNRPIKRLIKVVLPAPEPPLLPTKSPRSILIFKFSKPTAPP